MSLTWPRLQHRYDTSFFVLLVTDAEAAPTAADQNEVTEHVWWTPREALDAYLASIIQVCGRAASSIGLLIR